MSTLTVTPLACEKLKEFLDDFDMPYARVGQLTTGGG